MDRSVFASVFKEEINQYIDNKLNQGYKEKNFYYHLKKFDQFCTEHHLIEKAFTRKMAEQWIIRKEYEATTTHYNRINAIKHFLLFLFHKGLKVYVTPDIKFIDTDFKPHIYTKDEINRYFHAVDTFDSSRNKLDKIQYPLLFRLLYCCGTRINETLGIRKQDVDLDAGIVKLFETKNNCERYIVLSDELSIMMKEYAKMCFYLYEDEEYIFRSASGGRCHGDTLYEQHRLFLKKACIPFIGGLEGSRLHDWRHTFAVNSFKNLIDQGIDMYVSLPILSTYLGHKTIYATEKYLRLTLEIYPYIAEQFKDKMDRIFEEVHYETN